MTAARATDSDVAPVATKYVPGACLPLLVPSRVEFRQMPLGSFRKQPMMTSCLASTANATIRRVQSYLGFVRGVDCFRRGEYLGSWGSVYVSSRRDHLDHHHASAVAICLHHHASLSPRQCLIVLSTSMRAVAMGAPRTSAARVYINPKPIRFQQLHLA